MYSYRTINRVRTLHPIYRRYRRVPAHIRSHLYTSARDNPRSLLAFAWRALHRPYYGPRSTRLSRSNVNRRRVQYRRPRS